MSCDLRDGGLAPKGLAASSNRDTCTDDHLPPRAVGMPRSLSAAAMARNDLKPAAWSSLMIGTALSKYPASFQVPDCPQARARSNVLSQILYSNANNVSQPKAKTAARTRISAGKMRLMRRE